MAVKNSNDEIETILFEKYNLSFTKDIENDLNINNIFTEKDLQDNTSISIQEKNKFYNDVIEKILKNLSYLESILDDLKFSESSEDEKDFDKFSMDKKVIIMSSIRSSYRRDIKVEAVIDSILEDKDTNSEILSKIYKNGLEGYSLELFAHPNCPDEILKDVITGMDIYDFYVMMKQPEKIKEDKDKKNIKNLKSRKNVMSIYETANDINTPTIQLRKILFTGSLFEAVLVLVNPNLDEKTFCEFYEYFGSEKEDIKEKLNKEFPHNNLKSWEIIYLSFGIRRENISIKMLDYLYNNYVVSMYEFLEKYKKERSFYLDFKYYEYSSKFILQNKITPFYILKDLSERASILNNDPFNDRRDPELYNILQDMIFQHPNYTIKNYLADFINN